MRAINTEMFKVVYKSVCLGYMYYFHRVSYVSVGVSRV
jgi:hypothetical protein